MSKPFSGVRILDFTQVLAGPYATSHLAMLGADVVKVEQPAGGDQARDMLPAPGPLQDNGLSPMFISMNAGKRSLTLDLKRSEEHTSELQSLMRISYAVFCLKKKNITKTN